MQVSLGENPMLYLFVQNEVDPIMAWYGANLVHSIFLWLISVEHSRLSALGQALNVAKVKTAQSGFIAFDELGSSSE